MTGKYILLIEDNPDEVVLAKRAFEICQITIECKVVCDGREALDFLFGRGKYLGRDTSEKPALVLLDLNLPVVGGLQVLKIIRAVESTCKVPVVVLTSSTEESDEAECFKLGANEYVRKPIGFSQFIKKIQQLESRWLDSNGRNPGI